MEKRELQTKNAPAPAGPYSQGIVAGNIILTAGQVGVNPATGEMPKGVAEQTKQALENIRTILKEAGADMGDGVKATVHLADFDDFDGFNEVYKTFFSQPYPVRTTVESVLDGPLVEIDVMAVKG